MNTRSRIATAATFTAIFVGALTINNAAEDDAKPAEVGSSDCWVVPPRGLPTPCGGTPDGGWHSDRFIQTGTVLVGCAAGAARGGGPIGCIAGALTAFAAVVQSNLDD